MPDVANVSSKELVGKRTTVTIKMSYRRKDKRRMANFLSPTGWKSGGKKLVYILTL